MSTLPTWRRILFAVSLTITLGMIVEYWMMQSQLNKGLLHTFEEIDRWTAFAFYTGPIAFALSFFGRGFLRIINTILIPILFAVILEPGVHK